MPLYTNTQPSKSLADRLHSAEFDDAIIEQHFWKNPRYDGCKVISKEINKYTPLQTSSNAETGVGFANIINVGEGIGNMTLGGTGQSVLTVGGYYSQNFPVNGRLISHPNSNAPGVFKVQNFIPNITWQGDSLNPAGLSPNIIKETTALYISNTVIGGDEDDQFATIKNHSYININQILLIDPITDETQLIDKQAEDFTSFHSFITNDFPTQSSFSIRVIDEAISHNLKGPNQYKTKMNKGFLLKSFNFKIDLSAEQLTENNSMYLYTGGDFYEKDVVEGVENIVLDSNNDVITPFSINTNRIRFKYGTIETLIGDSVIDPQLGAVGNGHMFDRKRIGPNFSNSSIIANKFTKQYYSGSFGLINEPSQPQGIFNEDVLKTSGLGSASRFIGISSLNFLSSNNKNPLLSQQDKTELHLTLFEGTKDFGRGSNDERSISTFEVDFNHSSRLGTTCQDFLPLDHELFLKGLNDDRFTPKISTFKDSIINGYLTGSTPAGGCVQIGDYSPVTTGGIMMQLGIIADKTINTNVYVQGGILGEVGNVGAITASTSVNPNNTNIPSSLSSVMTEENYYSGSFSYELSFLDKDHTIITNLDKTAELFDGIGVKGVVLIPTNTHPKIKNNINFYLKQAGILPTSPNAQVQLIQDS